MQNILILYNSDEDSRDYKLFRNRHEQTIKHSVKGLSVTFDFPENVEGCAEKYKDRITGSFTRVFSHSRWETVKRCFPGIVSPYSSTTPGYDGAVEAIQQVIGNDDNFVETVSAQFESIAPKNKDPRQEWADYCGRVFDRSMVRADFDKFLNEKLRTLGKHQFLPDSIGLMLEFIYALKEKAIVATSDEIVGNSPQIEEVRRQISLAAVHKTTVLIRGETGTGKELIARAVHCGSQRKSKRFYDINCGALTETILESELFGHEKGAFNDARERKDGKFKAADGGTLFLDEIGEATKKLQVKLLRVLETGQFERVGGNETVSVDVRIITATNRNLEKEVAAGKFRHDLFFRLQVLEITIPPLRKRQADIPILAEHFLDRFCKETGRKYTGFHPDALQVLLDYHWPGNVRELKNIIERAVVLGTEPLIVEQDLLLSKLNTTSKENEFEVMPPQKRQPKSLDELKNELKKISGKNKFPKGITSALENLAILDPLLDEHFNNLKRVARKYAEQETLNRLEGETDEQNAERYEKEYITYYDQIRQWRSTGGRTIRKFGFNQESLGLLAKTFPHATLASDGIRRIWDAKPEPKNAKKKT